MKTYITDFVEDLNYHKIILNLKHIDKGYLEQRLRNDALNKVYRLAEAQYLYVANCDFQGEEIEVPEDLEDMVTEGYSVYDLMCDEHGYYYEE